MVLDELTPLTGSRAFKPDRSKSNVSNGTVTTYAASIILVLGLCVLAFHVNVTDSIMNTAWSSDMGPYSTADPRDVGFRGIARSDASKPGPIFQRMQNEKRPLPTNSWCENLFLGQTTTSKFNQVFQVPYLLGTGGSIPGVEGWLIKR